MMHPNISDNSFLTLFFSPSLSSLQVAVKPAFDPSLLRLRDEMEEGKRRMEGLAKEAGKKIYGQVKDADKKVKLDWRWVSGVPEGGLSSGG